jgi:hypothetical protein
MRSILLGICSLFVTNCMTLDKLRTGGCEDIINNSPVIDPSFLQHKYQPWSVVLCSTNTGCCLIFVEESKADKSDILDGTCYLGDSKYRHITVCRVEK